MGHVSRANATMERILRHARAEASYYELVADELRAPSMIARVAQIGSVWREIASDLEALPCGPGDDEDDEATRQRVIERAADRVAVASEAAGSLPSTPLELRHRLVADCWLKLIARLRLGRLDSEVR